MDDGRIVAGGGTTPPTGSGGGVFAAARYLGSPQLDTTTLPPILVAPASQTNWSAAVSIVFSLPEPALPGSVKLVFQNGVSAKTLTLGASQTATGEHSFSFDRANPIGSSSGAIVNGDPIPDGVYTVTLIYQDELGNPSATSNAATNVVADATVPSAGTLTINPSTSGVLPAPQ